MTTPEVWSGMPRPFFNAVKTYLGDLANYLHLMDWTVVLETEPSQFDDAMASCDITYGRKRLCVSLAGDFATVDPDEVRHVLTHELVHAHLDAVDTILAHTMPSALGQTAWGVLREVVHREVELATDALADALAPLLPAFVPPPDVGESD